MAVGKSFFDQYSVFCVFGSVVGCVVVPLITQSVESVIFSAIVISLTATHLTRRNTIAEGPGKITKDEKKKKESQTTKKRKKGPPQHQHSPTRQVTETRPRKKRDDGVKKMEELKMLEQERKELEKKERRTKKKEEREIRKEEERVIKERELQKLQNIKEQKEKQKGKSGTATNCEKTKSLRGATQTCSKKQDKVISLSKLDSTLLTRPLVTDPKIRQRTSSCSDNSDEQLSPPPSVWKVPEYAPPKWNPGQPEQMNMKLDKYDKHVVHQQYPLNNDSEYSRSKTKPVQPFNQLYNHTTNMQANFKNQFMNQDVKHIQETCLQQTEPPALSLKERWSKADNDLYKPDNRQFYETSSISQIPDMWQILHSDYTKETSPSGKEYTLFGPEEPNRSIFTPPNLSTLGNV